MLFSANNAIPEMQIFCYISDLASYWKNCVRSMAKSSGNFLFIHLQQHIWLPFLFVQYNFCYILLVCLKYVQRTVLNMVQCKYGITLGVSSEL
jgi:hypothetical protein